MGTNAILAVWQVTGDAFVGLVSGLGLVGTVVLTLCALGAE